METGRIVSVWLSRYGKQVLADAAAGTQVLSVDFPIDFDPDGGVLQHLQTGDVFDYTAADSDADTITLAEPLPDGVTFTAGDMVYVSPRRDELYADVQLDGADEQDPIEARVPYAMRPTIPTGVREPGAGEVVQVEEETPGRWVIHDATDGAEPATYELRNPETGETVTISPDEIGFDNDAFKATIHADLINGLLIASNLGVTIQSPKNPLILDAPEIDIADAEMFVRAHPVALTMRIKTPPATAQTYSSTDTETVMTATQIPTQTFLDDHVYRAKFAVQYDATGSAGVGATCRFRVRLGTTTSDPTVGGADTPAIPKVYGSFRPTQYVDVIWTQVGDLDAGVVLTVQRELQSTGTVLGQVDSTDFFGVVEDLGPAAVLGA